MTNELNGQLIMYLINVSEQHFYYFLIGGPKTLQTLVF